MKVVIVGTGYVGLVTGCCLAEAGHRVTCVDHDADKLAQLRAGKVPFFEPKLGPLLAEQMAAGTLTFADHLDEAATRADVIFLAVGTPPLADGRSDLENLYRCAHDLLQCCVNECIVVIKSTVPVGTCDELESFLNTHSAARSVRIKVASNPEFLAEGRAVDDFRHPDRIVIGTDDIQVASTLASLYKSFDEDGSRIMVIDRRSAEFAKYACNAMLAARISMINELARIAADVGADVKSVCRVIQRDPRIGASYLHAGVGYGGSCLPKDLLALIHLARQLGEPSELLMSVQHTNRQQLERLANAIRTYFDDGLRDKRIAIWGLSFKPNTDDVREAPALALIPRLLEEGAHVHAYDPVAREPAKRAIEDPRLHFGESALQVCEDADALVVMTEWDEFDRMDFAPVARLMRGRIVFDARGIYMQRSLQQYGLELYQFTHPSRPTRDYRSPYESGLLRQPPPAKPGTSHRSYN